MAGRNITYTAATLRLWAAGINVKTIADDLGVRPEYVSRCFSGARRYPPELLEHIAARGGRELADEIEQLIPGEPQWRPPRPRVGAA